MIEQLLPLIIHQENALRGVWTMLNWRADRFVRPRFFCLHNLMIIEAEKFALNFEGGRNPPIGDAPRPRGGRSGI